MISKKILGALLLLWGILYSNSGVAVSFNYFKVQKIYLSNGTSLRGYIKKQIVGDDFLTFCKESGDTTVLVDDIKLILSDVDSEDNINKLKRAYTLTDGSTIVGRYYGETPGKFFYVETEEGIDTLNRNDVLDWTLLFSQLKFENIPILDKVTESRENSQYKNNSPNKGLFSKSKKGLIVYQNFHTGNNVLRLMLDDGGFETIRVRDIDILEKEGNDDYIAPQISHFSDDSCVVNNMVYGFVHGDFRRQKSENLYKLPFPNVGVDFKLSMLINKNSLNVDSLEIFTLVPVYSKKGKIYFDLGEKVSFEPGNYDEYANVLELIIYYKVNDNTGLTKDANITEVKQVLSNNLGFVVIDKSRKKYLPFKFNHTLR